MTDADDPSDLFLDHVVADTDGEPDSRLDPTESPGVDADVAALEDIEVSRDDVEIGEADPVDMTVADTAPVADVDVATLVEALADGTERERQRAAIALGQRSPDGDALDALAERATADPDADVRQFAVEALGDQAGTERADAAVAALDDGDPWVRAEAVVALDAIDRERFADQIEAELSDDHPAVRRNALVSLWKRRGPAAVETVLAFVDDDSDRVREWVATMLADVEDERADRALAALARDRCDVVAKTARRALTDGERDPDFDDAGAPSRSSDPETAPHDAPPDL